MPPQIIAPLMPLASSRKRLLVQPSSQLHAFFHISRGRVQRIEAHNNQREEVLDNSLNANQPVQLVREIQLNRTVTFQDSYGSRKETYLPSDKTFRDDPNHLIGFQADPQLQERQKQQQRAENKADKRAREQAEQGEQPGTSAIIDPSRLSPLNSQRLGG